MSETLIFEDDIGTAYEDEPSVDPDDATVVLAEQTLTFDGTNPLIIELSSPLVVGQTYRVMWNGTAYTSTAADVDGAVFVGNAAVSGLDGASDTGEPFAIAYFDGGCFILTLDAGDHTVAIYQEVEDVHASNDAVILSYSQNPVEYKAVPKVWLTHPDSTEEAPVLVPFTYGELLEGVEIMPDFAEGDMQISVPDGSLVKEATIIKPEDLTPENIRKGVTIGGIEGEFLGDTEEIEVELDMVDGDQVILPSEDGKVISKAIVAKPDALAPENIRFGVNLAGIEGKYTGAEAEEVAVDLDFSEGDMVIAPEEDKVFSTVKIPKPDTLIPENIAKGVDIAGIVGTLAAGGGGSGKVAYGFLTPTVSTPNTITHDLGVVPDIIFVYFATSVTGTRNTARVLHGVSTAFGNKNGVTNSNQILTLPSSGWNLAETFYGTYVDSRTSGLGNANETQFTINAKLATGYKYLWVAIGGLT